MLKAENKLLLFPETLTYCHQLWYLEIQPYIIDEEILLLNNDKLKLVQQLKNEELFLEKNGIYLKDAYRKKNYTYKKDCIIIMDIGCYSITKSNSLFSDSLYMEDLEIV